MRKWGFYLTHKILKNKPLNNNWGFKLNRTIKVAGINGVIAPIVAFTCILGAIASYAPFNWVNNALSDLGVQSGVTAPIFNLGLVISGLLFLVFSIGLFRSVGKSRLGKTGVIVLCLACISLVSIGIFNENFKPTHYLVSVAFFTLMPISMLVLVTSFWSKGQRQLSLFTLTISLTAAIPWVLQFTVPYVLNVAIPEFVSGLAGAIWVEAVSVMMLRELK
jgi:hypothetical membrane protein